MLQPVLEFIFGVMNEGQTDPKNEDGGLHMLGQVGPAIIKSKVIENLSGNFILVEGVEGIRNF